MSSRRGKKKWVADPDVVAKRVVREYVALKAEVGADSVNVEDHMFKPMADLERRAGRDANKPETRASIWLCLYCRVAGYHLVDELLAMNEEMSKVLGISKTTNARRQYTPFHTLLFPRVPTTVEHTIKVIAAVRESPVEFSPLATNGKEETAMDALRLSPAIDDADKDRVMAEIMRLSKHVARNTFLAAANRVTRASIPKHAVRVAHALFSDPGAVLFACADRVRSIRPNKKLTEVNNDVLAVIELVDAAINVLPPPDEPIGHFLRSDTCCARRSEMRATWGDALRRHLVIIDSMGSDVDRNVVACMLGALSGMGAVSDSQGFYVRTLVADAGCDARIACCIRFLMHAEIREGALCRKLRALTEGAGSRARFAIMDWDELTRPPERGKRRLVFKHKPKTAVRVEAKPEVVVPIVKARARSSGSSDEVEDFVYAMQHDVLGKGLTMDALAQPLVSAFCELNREEARATVVAGLLKMMEAKVLDKEELVRAFNGVDVDDIAVDVPRAHDIMRDAKAALHFPFQLRASAASFTPSWM